MFSKLVTDLLQDMLKHRFRWFGYWLFLSEMALALFFTVAALGDGPVLATPFAAYVALTFYQMRQFAKNKPVAVEREEVSFGRSCMTALVSMVILIVVLIGAAFVIDATGGL